MTQIRPSAPLRPAGLCGNWTSVKKKKKRNKERFGARSFHNEAQHANWTCIKSRLKVTPMPFNNIFTPFKVQSWVFRIRWLFFSAVPLARR
jgi:hypothetical protein